MHASMISILACCVFIWRFPPPSLQPDILGLLCHRTVFLDDWPRCQSPVSCSSEASTEALSRDGSPQRRRRDGSEAAAAERTVSELVAQLKLLQACTEAAQHAGTAD